MSNPSRRPVREKQRERIAELVGARPHRLDAAQAANRGPRVALQSTSLARARTSASPSFLCVIASPAAGARRAGEHELLICPRLVVPAEGQAARRFSRRLRHSAQRAARRPTPSSFEQSSLPIRGGGPSGLPSHRVRAGAQPGDHPQIRPQRSLRARSASEIGDQFCPLTVAEPAKRLRLADSDPRQQARDSSWTVLGQGE
jgi:hypothetical protein